MKQKNDGLCCPINLQLFAEEPETVETVEATETVEPVTEPVVEQEETQVDIDPEAQSKDKNHPANRAFAEKAREARRARDEMATTQNTLKEIDAIYIELAKQSGFDNVKSAADYAKLLREQELSTKYKNTNDPSVLAEIVAEKLKPVVNPAIKVDPFANEIEALNTEYGLSVKTIEEVVGLDNSDTIIDLVEKGVSLSDAYLIANKDAISKSNAEKVQQAKKQAKQEVINQLKGNSHVQTNSNSGNIDDVEITPAEIANMKRFFPKKSTDQITKELKTMKMQK